MTNSILNENNRKSLALFLKEYKNETGIDETLASDIIREYCKYHDNEEYDAIKIKRLLDLETAWYESLKNNSPDYNVYLDSYYLYEVWLCWIKYSKNYLKSLSNKIVPETGKTIVEDIKAETIIDLGCGFGYTTAGLKELFPHSRVLGTNMKDSYQYRVATILGKNRNFEVVDSFQGIRADLIFASEYFEHFLSPLKHLQEVIDQCEPKYFIVANSFNTRAIGHFISYENEMNKKITGNAITKMFYEKMKFNGYEKIKTTCWNNRPGYWKKYKESLYD